MKPTADIQLSAACRVPHRTHNAECATHHRTKKSPSQPRPADRGFAVVPATTRR